VKDGIVYDAKKLLADVAAMVEKQKQSAEDGERRRARHPRTLSHSIAPSGRGEEILGRGSSPKSKRRGWIAIV
jgi:hypothetical protein